MTKENTPSSTSVDSIVHTPGPWKWSGRELWHFGEGYLGEGTKNPHLFAGIEVTVSLSDSPVVDSNKRLIAEAPEMVKVIEIIANATGDTDLEYAQELSQEILMRLKVV